MHNLGYYIRILRNNLGLTQEELLEDEYSKTYISRVENGNLKPSDHFIEYLSRKLNINLFELHSFPNENKIIDIYKKYYNNNSLSNEDISLIEFNLVFSYNPDTYVMIYTILIGNKSNLQKEKLINRANNFISVLDDKNIKHNYYNELGKYFYKEHLFGKALIYFEKSLDFAPNEIKRAHAFYNISLCRQRVFMDFHCLKYTLKSIQIYKDNSKNKELYDTYITLGVQLYLLGYYEESEYYLIVTKRYMEEQGNGKKLSKVYYNLGNLHQKMGKENSSLKYYKIYESFVKDMAEEKMLLYVYRNLIMLYFKRNDLEKAEKYINKFKNCPYHTRFIYLDIQVDMYIARMYKNKEMYKYYVQTLNKCLDASKNFGFLNIVYECSEELAEYYFDGGKYKKSAELLIYIKRRCNI
ncbi:helix-turn-helix domain-containing protein [Saliterribacillus persicus]|uniref:Helix-turn-helix protein n=1 Tax=Saliterribacillus persicus TaxID=930114 RepID=A0A368X7J6_9BACI|nr:helix-turn-helix transcriptional regulator [Saliterribacillus persicus]RCW63166.1 helix-turn-helix protein [Saliterribacillus persicus]